MAQDARVVTFVLMATGKLPLIRMVWTTASDLH